MWCVTHRRVHAAHTEWAAVFKIQNILFRARATVCLEIHWGYLRSTFLVRIGVCNPSLLCFREPSLFTQVKQEALFDAMLWLCGAQQYPSMIICWLKRTSPCKHRITKKKKCNGLLHDSGFKLGNHFWRQCMAVSGEETTWCRVTIVIYILFCSLTSCFSEEKWLSGSTLVIVYYWEPLLDRFACSVAFHLHFNNIPI